jgi:hypothetical protein
VRKKCKRETKPWNPRNISPRRNGGNKRHATSYRRRKRIGRTSTVGSNFLVAAMLYVGVGGTGRLVKDRSLYTAVSFLLSRVPFYATHPHTRVCGAVRKKYKNRKIEL